MTRPPLFDGFPYILTLVVPGLHHVLLLPDGLPVPALVDLARAQVDANRLPMWLVLDEVRVTRFDADGSAKGVPEPPRGEVFTTGRLAPPVTFNETDGLRARQDRLYEFIARVNNGKRVERDETKGGRPATPEELTRLDGHNDDGSPRGLERCPTCHDWRGTCLDRIGEHEGWAVAVHCLCDNQNRCARCGARLDGHRLNANFYNPSDGRIWHAPGGRGLLHVCQVTVRWERPWPTGLPVDARAGRGDGNAAETPDERAEDEYPRYRVQVYLRSDGDPNRIGIYCRKCGPRLAGASPGVVFDGRGHRCKGCGRGLVA